MPFHCIGNVIFLKAKYYLFYITEKRRKKGARWFTNQHFFRSYGPATKLGILYTLSHLSTRDCFQIFLYFQKRQSVFWHEKIVIINSYILYQCSHHILTSPCFLLHSSFLLLFLFFLPFWKTALCNSLSKFPWKCLQVNEEPCFHKLCVEREFPCICFPLSISLLPKLLLHINLLSHLTPKCIWRALYLKW